MPGRSLLHELELYMEALRETALRVHGEANSTGSLRRRSPLCTETNGEVIAQFNRAIILEFSRRFTRRLRLLQGLREGSLRLEMDMQRQDPRERPHGLC